MFREELEDLKNLYMGRLSVIHVLEDESQDIDLFQGRVDGEKCAQLFQGWIDINSVDMAYICGPEPMMLAISEALKIHGLDKSQIRFELFASGQPAVPKSGPKANPLQRRELPVASQLAVKPVAFRLKVIPVFCRPLWIIISTRPTPVARAFVPPVSQAD